MKQIFVRSTRKQHIPEKERFLAFVDEYEVFDNNADSAMFDYLYAHCFDSFETYAAKMNKRRKQTRKQDADAAGKAAVGPDGAQSGSQNHAKSSPLNRHGDPVMTAGSEIFRLQKSRSMIL